MRGNAMPETALVMSVVLLIFLGLIQLAEVGYQQSETDAAAFVAAHEGSFGSTGANQTSYGQSSARNIFKDFPSSASQTITVMPGTSSTPNPGGNVVAYANRVTGGLFLNKPGSTFNLHSFFIEPAAYATPYASGTSSIQILTANPPNCTTNNVATPTCSGMASAMATPNPSKSSDPFYPYACHALYYAVLSNGSGFYWPSAPGGDYTDDPYFAPMTEDLFSVYQGPPAASAINYVLPDNASLASLTDQNGSLVSDKSWPLEFQPTSHSGINNASIRSSGTWLTTQYEANGTTVDPANADGTATVGGTLGSALKPIFNFGGGSSKC